MAGSGSDAAASWIVKILTMLGDPSYKVC